MNYRMLMATFLVFGLIASPCTLCAAPKALSPRSLSALMDQAREAVLAGEYKAARDDFSDILLADPRNQMALEGATFTYLELGDYAHAKECFEKSEFLSPQISRPTAINGAAIYLHFKTPMRSAKILTQYMKPMSTVDELALNALASSLSVADDQARKGHLFSEAVAFYMSSNKKLEATRPGEKRWGTTWIPADEADKKNAKWSAALASASKLENEISSLNSQLAAVMGDATYSHGRTQRNAQFQASRLSDEIAAKQADVKKALSAAERPPIPSTISPLNIFAENLPQIADATTPNTRAIRQPPTSDPPSLGTTLVKPPQNSSQTPEQTSVPPPPSDAGANDSAAPAKKTYRVTIYAAAFPVAPDLLVTSADTVTDASDIQVQDGEGTAFSATLVRSDPETGLALIRVARSKFAYLSLADQFTGGALTCVSFPNVDLFQPVGAQLNGSAVVPGPSWKVHLSESPRLGGGPLLSGGKVVGVELASRDSDASSIPSVTLDQLRKFLGADAASGGSSAEAVSATMQLSAVRVK